MVNEPQPPIDQFLEKESRNYDMYNYRYYIYICIIIELTALRQLITKYSSILSVANEKQSRNTLCPLN